ncbi:MAG: hypothetical protein HPY45_17385 [Anaerolineae bacterium]|nr:hypothetical protein [Anaerolineae bacterium]
MAGWGAISPGCTLYRCRSQVLYARGGDGASVAQVLREILRLQCAAALSDGGRIVGGGLLAVFCNAYSRILSKHTCTSQNAVLYNAAAAALSSRRLPLPLLPPGWRVAGCRRVCLILPAAWPLPSSCRRGGVWLAAAAGGLSSRRHPPCCPVPRRRAFTALACPLPGHAVRWMPAHPM